MEYICPAMPDYEGGAKRFGDCIGFKTIAVSEAGSRFTKNSALVISLLIFRIMLLHPSELGSFKFKLLSISYSSGSNSNV